MTDGQDAGDIHISPSARGFGLGFGAHHQIMVYTGEGPKTGALLPVPECAEIEKWVDAAENTRAITDFIPPAELTGALQNRLLHADTIELVRILPKLLEPMTPEERALFFGEPVSQIGSQMWKEIIETRPELVKQGLDPKHPECYFSRLMAPGNGKQLAENGEDILFNGVSMEAAAAIFPMLFEAVSKESHSKATQTIANALHAAGEDKAFFAPLADIHINRLVITDNGTGPCQDVINNGRTLMIRSSNGPRVKFQGDEFTGSNLHFHPLKNPDPNDPVRNTQGQEDAKPEFMRYKDARHKALCRENPHLDPNRNVVGQLHTIFTAEGKRALLLGTDVELGEPNAEIGKYIDFLKAQRNGQPLEIISDVENKEEVAAKAVPAGELAFNPLACYKNNFDADGMPEAPFMSLHLGGLSAASSGELGLKDGKSDVFYRGVRVIYLPDPITVSPEQLKALRELQPVLRTLDEESCVHPRPRFEPVQERWKEVARTEPSAQIGLAG